MLSCFGHVAECQSVSIVLVGDVCVKHIFSSETSKIIINPVFFNTTLMTEDSILYFGSILKSRLICRWDERYKQAECDVE